MSADDAYAFGDDASILSGLFLCTTPDELTIPVYVRNDGTFKAVYNANNNSAQYLRGISHGLFGPVAAGYKRWYHGCTNKEARTVLLGGQPFTLFGDFGSGFYITPSFDWAASYAHIECNPEEGPAILAFDMPIQWQDEHLIVTGDSWAAIVYANLTNRPGLLQAANPTLSELFGQADGIFGRQSKNYRLVVNYLSSTPRQGRAYQGCVRGQAYSTLRTGLKGVLLTKEGVDTQLEMDMEAVVNTQLAGDMDTDSLVTEDSS